MVGVMTSWRLRRLRRRGDRARDAGRWGEAADLYRRYLANAPDDFAIHVQLGHASAAAGDAEAAEKAYAAAERLGGDYADLLLCWGHLRRGLGDINGSADLYARSQALDRMEHGHAAVALAELRPSAEPETVPDTPVRYGGRIERVYGRTVEGVMDVAEDGRAGSIEFSVSGRIIGRAFPHISADGHEFDFKTLVDGEGGQLITAQRSPDGAPLENSPFRLPSQPADPVPMPLAREARFVIVKPFGMAHGSEVALFVTHSATGALKPHVVPYLSALRRQGIAVFLIAVADRPLDLTDAVLDLVTGAIVRENAGYDFASWAHAAALYPEVYGASLLYLLNDSMSAPSGNGAFEQVVARVRTSSADLVGLTESMEYRRHLQSYFLALKPGLLSSYALQHFFGTVRSPDDKNAVIQPYALRFAVEMEAAGFETEVLFPNPMPVDPTLSAWRTLVTDGFPFMKLPLQGEALEANLADWRGVLDAAGFDLPLIDATIGATGQAVLTEPDTRLTTRAAVGVIPLDHAGKSLKIAVFGPFNYEDDHASAARDILCALRRTGASLNIHPVVKPLGTSRPLVPPVETIDFGGPADIAIVFLNPDSWDLLTDDQLAIVDAAGKRIGCWMCGMDHVPAAWWRRFGALDRIWTPSRYCAEIFSALDSAPADVIPVPMPLPVPSVTPPEAAAYGLPANRRIILSVSDGSNLHPRVPHETLIRAFAASGLAAAGWLLVLQTNLPSDQADIEKAPGQQAASDVCLMEQVLPAESLMKLIELADIYVSLQCAGIHGSTIAKAMAAGKSVIAIDFGDGESIDGTTGYPIRARRRRGEDCSPCVPDEEAVQIDEAALIAALIEAAGATERGDHAIGIAARARILARLSYDTVSKLIGESLHATMADRQRHHPASPITPSFMAGVPVERIVFDTGVRLVMLAADGSVLQPSPTVDPLDDPAEWVVFAPAGSPLHPLFERILLDHAARRPDVSVFYADDFAARTDKPIDQLRLKPAFDSILLAAQDYIGVPLMIRSVALSMLGGLRAATGTAVLNDLLFRAAGAGLSIERISEVLLASPGERCRATLADRRSVLEATPAFAACEIVDGLAPDTLMLRRRFSTNDMPEVTLVIPTRRTAPATGGESYLERLLHDIARTDWPMDRLVVIVGDDIPDEPDWARPGAWPFTVRRIETVRGEGEAFSYAAKMNTLWRLVETEHLVLLNDDVRAPEPNWLRALMTFAMERSVGGVGARLLYENGRLQHAGIAPFGPAVSHVWVQRRRAAGTYQEWARVQRRWSMVTGAVFATRRTVMEAVDGFDEQFTVEFNDTDLCLRMGMLGYHIVCTPDAEMVHVEKASRGPARPAGDQLARFLSRWRGWFVQDPCWHPGLRLDRVEMTPRHEDDAWYR